MSTSYVRRADGSFLYPGSRPADGRWHGHGYFARNLWVLRDGGLVLITLWKHRWRDIESGATCHSRSSEELGSVGACVLVVVLAVYAWLDEPLGLSHRDRREQVEGLGESCASRRTIGRSLHRLVADDLKIQQAFRRAVIERSEPRPFESLFEGGLPPPQDLERRRWKDPTAVITLWRALTILLRGAVGLDVPAALLLAEARGRWSERETQSDF